MTAKGQTSSALRKLVIALAAGIPLILATTWLWLRASTRDRGEQLFHGQVPLTGHLVGHHDALPSEVVQCQNCHKLEADAPPKPAPAGTPSALVETVGPTLGPVLLTHLTARRGGPASEYTPDAFCRLLREGIDPTQIMIPQLMPRYTLTDAECNALWSYITL